MKAINPFTGKVCGIYPKHTEKEVIQIIDKVDLAFKSWKRVAFADRAKYMFRLGELLLEKKDWLSDLISTEMGKVKKEAGGEVEKCAWVCRYYAENAEAFLKNETIKTEASLSFVSFQPVGTILAIMPWNFPFWQVFRFLAPNLMAGNTGLLKHASNVPGCALAIEQLVGEAGFPEDVFRAVLISGSETKSVIENAKIKGVTLTGSTPAGKAVAAAAGAVLKKTVLELGGSDPYVILEDADIAEAAGLCASGRLLNAGQSCIGAKRFIVMDAVYDEFKAEFLKHMQAAVFGDPMDDKTTIGPMARTDLRDELHEQVTKSVEKGAAILCGGFVPQAEAAFYPATVLENVKPGMPAYHEELFGPVASLFRVYNLEEAVSIANDTVFGLGAAVFTRDHEKGLKLAETGVESGCVFINDFVKSDPRLPFGGVKESGYGRELSLLGIREFVNAKTVVLK
ncbi:NAD-dependent succinate-semialdehyde dehydrogenase [Mangrovibacterium diazotrophicum]|uniref:Succinate-semialdehyde dehydrogenase/glutarate-semialdehyde dehydrogenase n=1 Tax=Mangrovibacterium diazotrophicum TaxID=1261403 RepID=A0A419W9Y5_9BACT|nr:NAD-dependent succinate-semialdehyde dehydrogenase [Mangrovibacterium diazotrophicum]RKD92291.1 succinate-semialdehyde dehydrogenase/glutarate-semialdehyde dehydrogenase [Mangrovibacterium diazotrophicum]